PKMTKTANPAKPSSTASSSAPQSSAPACIPGKGNGNGNGNGKRSNYCYPSYNRPVLGKADYESEYPQDSSNGGFQYDVAVRPPVNGPSNCSENFITENEHAKRYVEAVCGYRPRIALKKKSAHNCMDSGSLGPQALYVCNGECKTANYFSGKEQGICYIY
ncbi:hypothetical protein GGI12_004802, partial [Dipsacomyces acuminosporus]